MKEGKRNKDGWKRRKDGTTCQGPKSHLPAAYNLVAESQLLGGMEAPGTEGTTTITSTATTHTQVILGTMSSPQQRRRLHPRTSVSIAGFLAHPAPGSSSPLILATMCSTTGTTTTTCFNPRNFLLPLRRVFNFAVPW